MCKVGDIILIDECKCNGKLLGQHSFIVVSDKDGTVEGLDYDIIANIMSSFKNQEQKEKKLSYDGNFPIANNDTVTNPHNNKDGFVKTEQLFYFSKSKLSYKVIGYVKPDIMDLLIEFINNSNVPIVSITDNL